MTAQALAERTADQLPTLDVPATQLTPIQMAYQLVAKGADFAAVREMIEFGKKLEADENEKAFNVAMAAAQADMRVVATNMANTQTRSRYADYAQLDRALRPIYSKHGFALSFDEADTPKPEHIRILCHVSHTGGHTRTYHRDMPADGKGAKGGDVMTKTHAAGAAASYAMRYLLRGIFNVAVGEEDRDGNNAPPPKQETITDAQVKELLELIQQAGTNAETFCEVGKIDAIPDLLAKDFVNAKHWLEERIVARKARATKATVPPNFDNAGGGNGR